MNKWRLFLALFILSCANEKKRFDTILRNGTVYDGTGAEPYKADIGINDDTIAFIGDLQML